MVKVGGALVVSRCNKTWYPTTKVFEDTASFKPKNEIFFTKSSTKKESAISKIRLHTAIRTFGKVTVILFQEI